MTNFHQPLARVCLAFCLHCLLAHSLTAQPVFSKSFTPSTIGPGSSSLLTFTIMNNSGAVVTDMAFNDVLPAGITIADVSVVASSCSGGTISAPAGGGTITFSDGSLAPNSSCTISLYVTSSTPGTHMNVSGDLTSSAGNSGPASADLTVSTGRPSLTKIFSPSTISPQGTSTLTFVIDNSANGSDALNLNLTDNFPPGMVVAGNPNAGNSCNGIFSPIAGSGTVSLVIGFVPAGQICTLTVDVESALPGIYDNVATLTSDLGTSGSATARLDASQTAFSKAFIGDPVNPGGTVTLEFTILNRDPVNSLTNITFTDDLSQTLAGLATTGTLPSEPCGPGSSLTGGSSITLMNGSLEPRSSCTFSVTLMVPPGASPGIYEDTTSSLSGLLGGNPVVIDPAFDRLFVNEAPIFTKSFSPEAVLPGEIVTMTFEITNISQSFSLTGISFQDPIETFLPGIVPVSLPASGFCGVGSQIFFGAPNLIMSGGSLDPGASCSFNVDFTVPDPYPGGVYTNTTSVLSGTLNGMTVNTAPASAELTVIETPVMTKQFVPNLALPGDTVLLEFTIAIDEESSLAVTDITFTDDLDATLTGLVAIGLPANDVCGMGSQLSGTSDLTLTGGSLPPGGSCTFSVPVQIPAGAAPGSYPNTTSNLSSTVSGMPVIGPPATAELQVVDSIFLSKRFLDDMPVKAGDNVILEFTVDNQTNAEAAGLSFMDDLSGMYPGISFVTMSPVMTLYGIALLSGSTIQYAGTVPANTSDVFQITLSLPADIPPIDHINRTTNLLLAGNIIAAPAVDTLSITPDDPFMVSSMQSGTSCPEIGANYQPDGSISVTVMDGASCMGTYDITLTPVTASSPLGNTPPLTTPDSYLMQSAGSSPFLFDDAGAGRYLISVREVGGCNVLFNPDTMTVTVAQGVDADPPVWMIKDSMGMTITDNDPGTMPTETVNVGDIVLDPGQCGKLVTYTAMGMDNCDGMIDAPGAVAVISITGAASTTASVTDDGNGNYQIDLFWGVGTSTVTLGMMDLSGNTSQLALIGNGVDPFPAGGSINCRDINLSLDAGGNAQFHLSELAPGANCTTPVSLTLETPSGQRILHQEGLLAPSLVTFNGCGLPSVLKATIRSNTGSCWSTVTLKQGSGPIFETGRHFDLWCFDEKLADIGLYFDTYGYPEANIPCYGSVAATFVADWVEPYDCEPGQDTAKIIYREFEAFDKSGRRATVFDTIILYRIPQLTPSSLFCGVSDTIYCSDTSDFQSPIILVGNNALGAVGLELVELTIENGELVFKPRYFDPKCGIQVHVDSWQFGSTSCEEQYKVRVELKQTCAGGMSNVVLDPPATNVIGGPPVPPNVWVPLTPDYSYWVCEFWLTDLDTLGPIVECKYDKIDPSNLLWPAGMDAETVVTVNRHCYNTQGEPVIVVPTGAHECAAHTYLPPLCVYDGWTGVKQVKASIDGIGSWILTPNGDTCSLILDSGKKVTGACYESHTLVKLPVLEEPYTIRYEVYDSCHNLTTHYCYLLVKDRTRPAAITDKGVTVSLSDKKVWVDAAAFDEGSYDNCGVQLLLARRSDWYEACIDLCDSIDWCCVAEHGDTLWEAKLQQDKHLDEVESHYAKTLEWLRSDAGRCGQLIYNAWKYDLMKYATLHCVDHPYAVDGQYFRQRFESCFMDFDFDCELDNTYNPASFIVQDVDLSVKFEPVSLHPSYGCGVTGFPACGEFLGEAGLADVRKHIDVYEQIGGGWSDAVPFSCDDACGPVTVEILVMDYWCNWSTAWTKVWVEDKTPVKVVKDVSEQEAITCKVYKENKYSYPGEDHPVSLEYIVEQAKLGTPDALDALDGIFGGYQKAWVDPYGHYVDSNGEEIEGYVPFYDSICDCKKEWKQVRVYDEHLGYLWVDSLVTECYYEADTLEFWNGIVAVNCAENVYCEQEVWCEFDHCGQGYIFRKFKIWSSCAEAPADSARHIPDTIYRHQRIWVGNECELSKYMFDRPYDTEVYTCNIEYGADGNVIGDAGPENTGYPVYQFDDDCRIVGIAHEDKVFKIVGGDAACYKILRTWYFADWCGYGGDRPVGKWWLDDGLVIDKYVQQIIVIDTVGPRCVLTGPVQTGDTVETGACEYELVVTVDASDACGLTSYYWELKDFSDADDGLFIDSGEGSLSGEEETVFDIAVAGLVPGTYKLLVTLRDECNNESYCEYTVVIEAGKKPTPVCISSLTARLTPWDSDNDGEIDTAHAVVWAYEFDRSSTPACGDDSLEYRIEFVDDMEDETPAGDLDYLEVGCAHIGTRLVRMWVISHPSQTSDYCDVVLVVQSDFTGCVPTAGEGDVMTYEENMTHPSSRPTLDRMGGDPDGIQIAGDAGLPAEWSVPGFTLEQNQPNPFRYETVIGFTLPEAMPARLRVFDVTGRLLKTLEGDFPKGYSRVSVDRDDLRSTGVLYYQLETKDYLATRKMVLLE